MGLRLEFECKELNLYYYGTKLCGYVPNDSLTCVKYLINKGFIDEDVCFSYATSPILEIELFDGYMFLIDYCNDFEKYARVPEELEEFRKKILCIIISNNRFAHIKCTITWG